MLEFLIKLLEILGTVGAVLTIHNVLFAVLGFFTTRKFKKAEHNHKYAVLIAARNEEKVIKNLIRSIRGQDYPQDLVTIFVVADNCTDNTRAAAEEEGAVVYERFDSEHRTKGYALQFLMKNIEKDYGIRSFEGYFFFDADNLLKRDFFSRMNDAFDSGEKLITSFRNTKNFSDNWISSQYAIHWYRSVLSDHRARSFLRLATRIQGTGFLAASEILKDGWNYVSLTEDRELSAYAALNGYSITYNDAAEFYDEQPIDVKIMMRQRIRWAKGHLWAFTNYAWVLFKGIFTAKVSVNGEVPETKRGRVFQRLRRAFICYDMFWIVFPRNLTSFFRRFFTMLLGIAVLIKAGRTGVELLEPVSVYLLAVAGHFPGAVFTGIYSLFMLRRRVPKESLLKKLWYCVTFSVFDKIGLLSGLIAMFRKVEWKPIPHVDGKSLEDMERSFSDK